jgi:hypothetical protein
MRKLAVCPLDLAVKSEAYRISGRGLMPAFARDDDVPYIDVVATLDPENGQVCVLMLDRDLDSERELSLVTFWLSGGAAEGAVSGGTS